MTTPTTLDDTPAGDAPDPATHDGAASDLRRMLEESRRLLFACIVQTLGDAKADKPVSAEFLHVARRVLRDNEAALPRLDEAQRKRLQDLHRLYVDRLLEAIQAPKPSTAVLAECRQFLATSGVGKDLGAAISDAQALAALNWDDLPFKPLKH